ncbi:MAG: GTPase Era [Aestuariivita sp.]|nr:GTPase Era [Aestuariivita sp.]
MKTRAGFVALIGEPNSGKSTLMNKMIGAKISIVTHKVQTTRAQIRGIQIIDQSQIIFLDTPGLFEPRQRLEQAMVATAWGGAEDADIVLLLIEAHRGVTEGVELIIRNLHTRAKVGPTSLAINKIDREKPDILLELSSKLNAMFNFDQTFMLSAKTGDGVADLNGWLAEQVPHGPWLYGEDQITDRPLRLIAAEVTREKLILRLHQELPYKSTVETEFWEERKDKSIHIEQVIYITRKGHKGIVLGNKGETIKAVSIAARKELEEFLHLRVHLFIRVKVRPNWMDERERYEQMGLQFTGQDV